MENIDTTNLSSIDRGSNDHSGRTESRIASGVSRNHLSPSEDVVEGVTKTKVKKVSEVEAWLHRHDLFEYKDDFSRLGADSLMRLFKVREEDVTFMKTVHKREFLSHVGRDR